MHFPPQSVDHFKGLFSTIRKSSGSYERHCLNVIREWSIVSKRSRARLSWATTLNGSSINERYLRTTLNLDKKHMKRVNPTDKYLEKLRFGRSLISCVFLSSLPSSVGLREFFFTFVVIFWMICRHRLKSRQLYRCKFIFVILYILENDGSEPNCINLSYIYV